MEQTKEPFPYRTNDRLGVCGSWVKGGAAVVERGGSRLPKRVRLSPTMFAVLVVLVLKAKSDATTVLDAWTPKGFLSKKEIFASLRRLGLDDMPYEEIHRYVHRLRNRFAATLGPNWTSRFFERDGVLGYRLSTRPENLQLSLIEDILSLTERKMVGPTD